MPLDPSVRQAVIEGARILLAGGSFDLRNTRVFSRWGITGTQERLDVVRRSAALAIGSVMPVSQEWQGWLADIYEGTVYDPLGPTGSPLDTPEATITFRYRIRRGRKYQMPLASITVPWTESISDIKDLIEAKMIEEAAKYGRSKPRLLDESIFIY